MNTLAMKKLLLIALAGGLITACNTNPAEQAGSEKTADEFVWQTEQFADIKILRYQVPGFDRLSDQQKELVYYLTEAGMAGRDIIYDQNYRYNLDIRRALEHIVANYQGEKGAEWDAFMVYTKRVWFSNGIHHHYSMSKITPEFSQTYFQSLLNATEYNLDPKIQVAMFDPEVDNKKVNLDPNKGLLLASATNFYDPEVTESEVDAFYAGMMASAENKAVSFGLNSKIVKNEEGQLEESVWKIDGMYGPAIEQIVYWLEKAANVAENEAQEKALRLLIEYYKTGDLETWDEYNVAWVEATEGDIDYINGFIEVYNDPKGYRGSYESIVEINDFDASERMAVVAENAQYFEDNSTIMDEHKKANVVGVSYKVVNVAGESGDAAPSTPIGVNLPNANWIRAQHGSKSVSLGNIVGAYEAAAGKGFLEEFVYEEEKRERIKEYGKLGSKMHTALHEVIGHASGQLNEGIGTPKETLKNYASTLEEARADLVALYFIMDPKMVELGLMPSLDVGFAEYDSYMMNGLMTQLRRLEEGDVLEEAHMRNRQINASWVFEKGQANNVVSYDIHDGKTYVTINDYEALRGLFGDLLREIQRIKSEGDYEAGRALVENYGVQVNTELHAEVLKRAEALNSAPYSGFINPVIRAGGDGEDAYVVEYPMDFTEQMMYYAEKYSFLK
jgi:dipeptidyl-peptidase-3